MALKKKEDRADYVEDQAKSALGALEGLAKERNGKKRVVREKMRTVTFQMKPSDYERLKEVLEGLGLAPGAGIRFALNEFMRKHQGK
jgi:hypothetical protein